MAGNTPGQVRGLYAAIELVDKASAPIDMVNRSMDRAKAAVAAAQAGTSGLQQQLGKTAAPAADLTGAWNYFNQQIAHASPLLKDQATRMDEVRWRMDAARATVENYAARVRTSIGTASAALQEHAQIIGMVGAAMTATGAAGTYVILQQAKSASELESMTANLYKRMGDDAEDLMNRLDAAAAGTVSSYDLVKNANYALMMGIDKEAIPVMMEAARAASRRFGGEISYYYESIATGTARQSKLILDNLGIIVDAEKAQKDYAASIGKTAAALTESEQKLAYQQEVMRQARKMIDETDLSTESYAEQTAQSAVELARLKNEVVSGAIPALSLFNGAVRTATSLVRELPAPLKGAVGLLALITTGAMATIGPLLTMAATSVYLGTTLGISSAAFAAFATSIGAATLAAAPWILAIGAIVAAVLLVQDVMVHGWEDSALRRVLDPMIKRFWWAEGAVTAVGQGIAWLQQVLAGFPESDNPALRFLGNYGDKLLWLMPVLGPVLAGTAAVRAAIEAYRDVTTHGWEMSALKQHLDDLSARYTFLRPLITAAGRTFEWLAGIIDRVEQATARLRSGLDILLQDDRLRAALDASAFLLTLMNPTLLTTTQGGTLLPTLGPSQAAQGSGVRIDQVTVQVKIADQVSTTLDEQQLRTVVTQASDQAAIAAVSRIRTDLRGVGA